MLSARSSPPRAAAAAFLSVLLVALACASSHDGRSATVARPDGPLPSASLRFRQVDGSVVTLGLESLAARCAPGTVRVDDPYHGRAMSYRAVPLVCALDAGFAAAGGAASLRESGLLLRALDGYTRPVSGRDLLEPGGQLAYGEPGRLRDGGSPFSPIDRRQVDPAPFYLVWSGEGQGDPHDTPWPYQLAEIAVAPFEEAFPATVPEGLAGGDPGWTGYRLFQASCASCHAINGQGGKVGPDLNVPMSIVEYRPAEQIRAYVRDPGAFRYTSMPSHPGLSDADLDALIAYFRAMRERKQDPRVTPAPAATHGAGG